MSYRACLFDLFGTLVPLCRTADYNDALRVAARSQGAPEEEFIGGWQDTYHQRNRGDLPSLEDNVRAVCARLGVAERPARLAAGLEPFRRLLGEILTPKPEAESVLAAIRRRGLALGLVSNCNPDVPALFRRGPLAKYFQALVFSSEVRLMKPEPAIYRLALERMALDPAAGLYIGDGHDRELAGAAGEGLRTVMVHNDIPGAYYWGRDETADHEVRDLREILPLLGD